MNKQNGTLEQDHLQNEMLPTFISREPVGGGYHGGGNVGGHVGGHGGGHVGGHGGGGFHGNDFHGNGFHGGFNNSLLLPLALTQAYNYPSYYPVPYPYPYPYQAYPYPYPYPTQQSYYPPYPGNVY